MNESCEQRSILVVEDDAILALEMAKTLAIAGVNVVGPVASEAAALLKLEGGSPGAAIIDLNTGDGVCLNLAAALKLRGIPFVILTGYPDWVIPREFADIPRFQKPADLKMVLNKLGDLGGLTGPRPS